MRFLAPIVLAGLAVWFVLWRLATPAGAVGITIWKEVDAETIEAGEPFSYTLQILNTTGNQISLVITDVLPANTSVVDLGGGTLDDGVIEWNVLRVDHGTTVQVTFSVVATRVGQVVNYDYQATSAPNFATGAPVSTTVIANDPEVVHLEAQPDPVQVGASSSITITVTDAYGNVVPDGTVVAIEFDKGTIDGQPAGTLIESSISGGRVYKTLNAGTVAGTAHVTATVEGAQGVLELALAPGPPFSLNVAALPASVPADGSSTAGITATVSDMYGNPIAATPVTITTSLGDLDGEGSSVHKDTNETGQAFAALSGTVAGTSRITVTAGALSDTSQSVYLAPGPPTHLVMSANPTGITANGASTSDVTLFILDENDNQVDVSIPATITTNLGTLTGGGTQYVETTTDGRVAVTLTSGTTAGIALVSGAAVGLNTDASVNLLPGPPAQIWLDVMPGAIPADGASTTSITATVADLYGNPVNTPVSVTISAGQGTLLPNAVGTTDNGVFVRQLRSNTVLASVPITATAAGVSESATGNVDFVVGPASNAVVELNPPSPVTVGQPSTLVVTVQDSVGHVVPGAPITLSCGLGNITPSPGGTTDPGGQLHRTFQSNQTGLDTIQIMGPAGGLNVSGGSVTFVPDAPAQAFLTANPDHLFANGTTTAEVTATIFDQYGNRVPAVVPNFTTSLGYLSGDSATNVSGVATRTLHSTTDLGTAIVSISGLTTVTNASVAFTAGDPAFASLDANPSTVFVYGAGEDYKPDETTLNLSVTDSVGHPIPGENLQVTSSFGSVIGSGPTDENGVLTRTMRSTISGQPDVFVAGLQATGDVVTFEPGPLYFVSVTPGSFSSPQDVSAGVPFTFTARAEDVFHNLLPGYSFVWNATTMGGYGIIDANGAFKGSLVGLVRIRATTAGKSGVSYANVHPGVAAQASIDAEPESLPADGVHISSLAFHVMDTYGNTVGYGVPIEVTSSIGIVEGSQVTTAEGVAYRTIRSFEAGAATLDVTGLITLTGDVMVFFTPGSPARATITASPGQLPANGSASSTIRVTLRDDYGNPVVAGYEADLHTSLGSIVPVSPGSSVTDETGTFTRTLTAPLVPGEANFTVTYLGSPLSASGDSVLCVVGPLHHVTATPGGPLAVIAGQAVDLNAQAYDANQAPLPLGRVTYGWDLIFTGPGRGVLDATPKFGRTTTFTGTLAGAGVQLVGWSDEGGAFYDDTVLITVVPGPPIAGSLAVVPPSISVGGTHPMTLTVSDLVDGFGNDAPDGTPITLTVQSLPAARTGATVVSGGLAQVVVTSTNRVGTYPITATGSGGPIALTGDTWATFEPGPPARAEILSADPLQLVADNVSTSSLVIQVRDDFENPVPAGISPVVTATLGTLVAGSTPTDGDGVLTRTLRAGFEIGDAEIGVNGFLASGLGVQLIPGPPVSAGVTVVTSTLAAGGAGTPVVFDVRDDWGRAVADGTLITPTLTPASEPEGDWGAWTGERLTIGGLVTQTLTPGTRVGTATVACAGLAGDHALVTFVPGRPALALVEAFPTSLSVNDTTALTITVTDAYSNVVPPTLVSIIATLGTFETGQSTITGTTAAGSGTLTADLTSTLAGTETLRIEAAGGSIAVRDDSEYVLFLPREPRFVSLEPTGPLTITAGTVLTTTASSRDRYGNAVDPWTPVEYTWWQSASAGQPGYGTLSGMGSNARSARFSARNAGTNYLWATGGVTTSNVLTLSVTPGQPSRADILIVPDEVLAGGASSFVITLSNVVDAFNNPVLDSTPLTISIPSYPPVVGVGTTRGAVMSRTLSSSTGAGSYDVSVIGPGGPLTLIGDKTIRFTPGPPVRATINALPVTLPADGTSTTALYVTLRDANANLVADGTPVTVTASLGTLIGQGSTINGMVQRALQAPIALGTASFQVSGPHGPLFVTGDTVDFVPGNPATAQVVAAPLQVPADGMSTAAITITVRDAHGFRVESSGTALVSVTKGSLSPTTTVASSGIFTTTFLAGTSTGLADFGVVFDALPLTTTGDHVQLMPGPAISASLTAEPTQLPVSSSQNALLTITLIDAWGRPIADGTVVTVTTTLGHIVSNAGTAINGVVTRTLEPGATTGTATFVVETPHARLIPYGDHVELTAGGLSRIDVSPAGPIQMAAGSSRTFSAIGRDVFGNPTGSGNFQWTLWSGSGSGTLSSNGVFTANQTGLVGIQAWQGTTYSPIVNVTIVPGAPYTATVSASPKVISIGDGTSELTITARDCCGNFVANGTVLNVTTNIGSVSGSSGTRYGVLTRTFQAGSFYGTATFFVNGWEARGDRVTLISGGPTSAEVSAIPAQLPADGKSRSLLTFELFDAAGMHVPDGTNPPIETSQGTLGGNSSTLGGILTRTLRSSQTPGVAHIYVNGFQTDGAVPFLVGPAEAARVIASPVYVMADGASQSRLSITAEDVYGHVITDVDDLQVTSSLGSISQLQPTVNGRTTCRLTASSQGGAAHIFVDGLPTLGDNTIHFVDSLVHGGNFEAGQLLQWSVGREVTSTGTRPAYTATLVTNDHVGAASVSIVPLSGSSMVRLGATTSDNTDHDIGEVWVKQPILVPSEGLTQFTFWYRLLSYDVAVGSPERGSLEWDPFEVYLNGKQVLQDGFTYSDDWHQWYQSSPTTPKDMGWKHGVLDVSSYAGKVVMLEFHLANRQAPVDNTWVYVDDVVMIHTPPVVAPPTTTPRYVAFMPLILRGQ